MDDELDWSRELKKLTTHGNKFIEGAHFKNYLFRR